MLNYISPISEKNSSNNFEMEEKTPVTKNKFTREFWTIKIFASKAGKILGMILPKESCSTTTKENVTCLWLGPNEWLLVSNDKMEDKSNLEEILYSGISKTNLGAVTNVTDHFNYFQFKRIKYI